MGKTLIFTITTGRSGTVFLTDFWQRNLPDARVVHEHQQWWSHGVDTPDHSDLMHFNNAGVTPKVRAFWRRKFERVLAEPGTIYAEASHYLAKAGLIENLDLLPEDVQVKIVRFQRDPYRTARSLFNLGEFQNPASSWVWLPPGAANAILQPGRFRKLGRPGAILWYVLEMRARGAYYRELLRERPGVAFVETGPEALREPAEARRVLGALLDGEPPAQPAIPPPRNDGQSRTVTTEAERAQFDQVYARVQGDAEQMGRQFFEQGRGLAHGSVAAPEPADTAPEVVCEQIGAVQPTGRGLVRIEVQSGADTVEGERTGALLVPAPRYPAVLEQLQQARERVATGQAPSAPYFFVTGYNKSGTTFLQMLLDAHPGVHCPPEHSLDVAMQLLRRFDAQYVARIRAVDEGTAQQGLRHDSERLFRRLLRTLVVTEMETGSRVEHLRRGLNDNRLLGSPNLYSAVFPDMQYLAIVRDPREAAVSLWHHNKRGNPQAFEGASIDAYVPSCADRWAQYVRGARLLQQRLGAARVQIVRYEDLIGGHREAILQQVLRWLGVDASEAAVQECFGYTDRVRDRKRADPAAKGFFRAGRPDTWREEVSHEAIGQLEARCAQEMRAMGYELISAAVR